MRIENTRVIFWVFVGYGFCVVSILMSRKCWQERITGDFRFLLQLFSQSNPNHPSSCEYHMILFN